MQALTREELDKMTCAGCHGDEHAHGPLFLHARCHMHAGTFASYLNGVLTVTCAKCKKLVAKIAVAEGRLS